MINKMKLDNMDKITSKYERKAKRISKKLKLIAVVIGIIGACCLMGLAFYNVSRWYDENRVIFQSPILIKLQAPIVIKPRKNDVVVPVKEAKKEVKERSEFEIVTNTKNGNILWNIYQLETQRGKTDGCRISGEGYGGFGVMDSGKVVCYPTFEKAVERASYWLSKLEPEKNLVDALCTWNLGTRGMVNCHYYQSYLSL